MSSEVESRKPVSKLGLATVGIFGGLATGLVALTFPFILPAFRKVVLPYIPATPLQIENVLKAVQHQRPFSAPIKPIPTSCRVIDLGSGDGRIVNMALLFIDMLINYLNVHLQVIECAKQGIRSHGVELNPWYILLIDDATHALPRNH